MKIMRSNRRQFLSGAASTIVLSTIASAHSPAGAPENPESQPNPVDPSRENGGILDALIIGGGAAGLSAALYLGRARRRVLVVDIGSPRNAVSPVTHNYLTRDGFPPAKFREEAWSQMASYPSVVRHAASIVSLTPKGDYWLGESATGTAFTTRAVILATGMMDKHPTISGYRERWGHSIHHCPFCHGREMRDKPLAVLSWGKSPSHLVPLLKNWSDDIVLLSNGQTIPDDVRGELEPTGTPIYENPIVALEGAGRTLERIALQGGPTLKRQGLFVKATQAQVELVSKLGVALDEHGFVVVDSMGATSLPGVWAAGDLTSGFQQIIEAASQGARVGAVVVAFLSGLTLHTAPHSTHPRDAWQKPLEVIKAIQIDEGMTVADVGAGEGYLEPYLSRATGPGGKVFAIDIEPKLVDGLKKRFASTKNIEARLGTSDDPGLALKSVDRIVILDTWHHLEDPRNYIQTLRPCLKPGGRIVIIDYELEVEEGPPLPMRIDKRRLLRDFEDAGFRAFLAPETLPRQFILIAQPDEMRGFEGD